MEQISSGRVTVEQFADSLGLARSTVYGWMQKWRAGGEDALMPNPAPGRAPALSDAQQRELVLLLRVNPLRLEFDFGLWTRKMVRELIRRRFGVEITVQAVGALLRRLGLSPQRPLYRAYQCDPEAVRRWKDEEFPKIRAEAAQVGAVVYFSDEASVRSDFHAGTTWSPVGETPLVESTGARFLVNMISAVATSGRFRFSVFDGNFDSAVFIDFCRRLIRDESKPVYLIVDGHSAHSSKKTREYVETTGGKLKIFRLPGYASFLNPDEHVWKNVKHDMVGRMLIEGRGHFEALRSGHRAKTAQPAAAPGHYPWLLPGPSTLLLIRRLVAGLVRRVFAGHSAGKVQEPTISLVHSQLKLHKTPHSLARFAMLRSTL